MSPNGIKFELVVTEEEIRNMAREQVARSLTLNRSGVDEDGEPWEEHTNKALVMMREEVRKVVASTITDTVRSEVEAATRKALADGWSVREKYAEPKFVTVADLVNDLLTKKTRDGYNNPELTMPERIAAEVLRKFIDSTLHKDLEGLRAKFKESLTTQYTTAAVEALRKAVGL